jgi:hypothetical protein
MRGLPSQDIGGSISGNVLPLPIILLVVAGYARVSNGATRRFWRGELVGPQPRAIVPTPPTRRALIGDECAFALPSPQRLRRDAQKLGRFVNADHLA